MSFRATVRTDLVDLGVGKGRKKEAEEAARTKRRKTKWRMTGERTARRGK